MALAKLGGGCHSPAKHRRKMGFGHTMATLGTLLKTMISGVLVGADKYGNRYYRGRGRNRHNRERRWVVYKGRPEASKVPPEWHSWLHHMTESECDPPKAF